MTDLETAARRAIVTLRMRYRVTEIPQADDEAVAAIVKAAGDAVIADGLAAMRGGAEPGSPEALAAYQEASNEIHYAEQADTFRELAAEILGAFKKSPNGWNARAKLADMEQWRERLGGSA
jgi:hypothetical protein